MLASQQFATLQGVLLSAATGRPIPGAKVLLERPPAHGYGVPLVHTTVTDEEGRFVVKDYSPGRYSLRSRADGYLEDFLVLDGNGSVEFDLRQGENRLVHFGLVPEASITGRVLDEGGQPIPGVSVAAVREVYAFGKRSWQRYHYLFGPFAVKTNRDGEYRIGGLRPGKYYLEAFLDYSPKEVKEPLIDRGYVPVYFPNADFLASATALCMSASAQEQADFLLAPRATFHMRGKLVFPSGPNHSRTPLDIVRNEYGELVHHWSEEYDSATNTFELGPFVPGSYVIEGGTGLLGSGPVARHSVEITNADIENMVLAFQPYIVLNVDVHLPYEIHHGLPLSLLDLQLDGTAVQEIGQPFTKSDRMTFRGLQPGRYKLFMFSDEPIYLKSARLGNQDVLRKGLTLDGPPTGPLEVEISRATGEVQGTVVTAGGEPASEADVKLIAQGDESQYVLKSVNADRDGRFQFSGVPPGKYDLLALTYPVRNAELDPFELARLHKYIKEVEVGDAAHMSVQLQVSTPDLDPSPCISPARR
ncbi:MAG: carboxypeptidase regulatory-like domain-containing protein [Terriglobia bacterium]